MQLLDSELPTDTTKDDLKTSIGKLDTFMEDLKNPPPDSPLRGPPTVTVKLVDLRDLLTCGLCKGYLVNATTLTECLHTFCKSCLVQYAYYYLKCPKCQTFMHPSDPFVNMRLDSTMQDIVYKLLPQIEQDEKKREKDFYESKGIPYPLRDNQPSQPAKRRSRGGDGEFPKWLSIFLEYAGASPGLGSYKPLAKGYLRIPSITTVGHIQLYIRKKMSVINSSQICVFVDTYMLHESLTMKDVWNMFYHNEAWEDIMEFQFGIVKNKNYFNTRMEKELEISESMIEQHLENSSKSPLGIDRVKHIKCKSNKQKNKTSVSKNSHTNSCGKSSVTSNDIIIGEGKGSSLKVNIKKENQEEHKETEKQNQPINTLPMYAEPQSEVTQSKEEQSANVKSENQILSEREISLEPKIKQIKLNQSCGLESRTPVDFAFNEAAVPCQDEVIEIDDEESSYFNPFDDMVEEGVDTHMPDFLPSEGYIEDEVDYSLPFDNLVAEPVSSTTLPDHSEKVMSCDQNLSAIKKELKEGSEIFMDLTDDL